MDRFCQYCKKKLRPFTGYYSYDWSARKNHKKCYYDEKVERLRDEILRNNLERLHGGWRNYTFKSKRRIRLLT